MSFEGYTQYICKNQHYWTCDAYSDFNICPYCGEIAIWFNMVDVTNGSWDDEGERIDGYVEPEVLEERKCESCGSILERKVKIPKVE